MNHATLDQLHSEILQLNGEVREMHAAMIRDSRALKDNFHELDKRLTRAEERILFFCAIAGATSGLLSQFVARFF